MKTWFNQQSEVTATYWALYPDGRSNEVTLESAKAFGDEWAKDGVRLMTIVRTRPLECIGTVEYDDVRP